jgi:hypothetical protein
MENVLMSEELKIKIKKYIIYNFILKVKRPVHRGLEESYYAFFNKYLRKFLSKYIVIFLRFYRPVLKLKFLAHNFFELDIVDEPIDLHCTHSFITGIYLWFFLLQYISLILCLYFLKKKIFKKIGRIHFKKKIDSYLIIFCLESNYENINKL